MKRTLKKSMSVLLTFTLLFGSFAFGFSDVNWSDFAVKAKAEDSATSGTCGDNLTWTFDESTGTLTISGTGDMDDWRWGSTPWYSVNSSIKNVSIDDEVTNIGMYAFSYCDSLTSITIPDSVISIGESAFEHCTSLINVTIGNSVTSIGDEAFYDCDSLTSITIPDSTTSIGGSAFEGCRSLSKVMIPEKVTNIDFRAFYGCANLLNINILGAPNIGYRAFEGSAYYEDGKNWENKLLYIDNCLVACEVRLNDNISEINVKNGTKVLSDLLFVYNENNEVDYSLRSTEKKITVNLPDTLESIGSSFVSAACVDEINVSDNNPYFKSVDGVLFNKDMTEIHIYPIGKKVDTYILPQTVKTIKEYSFHSACIYNLIINEGAKTIEPFALISEVGHIPRIYIPNSVDNISPDAFCDSETLQYYSGHIDTSIICEKNSYAYDYAINNNIPWADPNSEEVFSGSCGEKMIWSVNTHKRTLTISGTGLMSDGTEYNEFLDVNIMPWWKYRAYIDNIIIEDGVESASYVAFYGLRFKTIDLPNTLKHLGMLEGNVPFDGDLDLPDSLVSLGTISGNVNGMNLIIPNSTQNIGDFNHIWFDELKFGNNLKNYPELYDVVVTTMSFEEGTTEFEIIPEFLRVKNLIIPQSMNNLTINTTGYYGDYTVETIYCYENTYGHHFAIDNNIPYKFIVDEPDEPTTEPTTQPVEVPTTTKPAVTEPSTKPAETEPSTTKPIVEPTTKPVIEPTTEPTTEPTKPAATKPIATTKPATTKPEPTTVAVVEEEIIKKPSTTEVKYGETLILHADFENIPDGATIEWSVEGEGVTIVPSDDGKTCAVTSTSTGDVTITAKYTDANGVEHVSEQEIESNASFWQKIISFFKNLFGINRVISQIIKF